MKRIQAHVKRVLQRRSRATSAITHPMVIAGEPTLPPELERLIFELVAASDLPTHEWAHQHVGDTVLVLPQVCRRVQSWIDPFIYQRVALLQNFNGRDPVSAFLATVEARPATFFATHVKQLYLDRTVPLYAVQRILSVCTGVVSFGCHHAYSSLAPLLAPLPLARLLVSELVLPSTPASFPPWATSLSHLGLSDALPTDAAATLASLPALTHLAIDYDALPDPKSPGMGPALTALLSCAPRTCCLVLLTGAKTEYRWSRQRLRDDGFVDVRVYVHLGPVGDAPWHAWGWRVPDCFAVAEERVRRQG